MPGPVDRSHPKIELLIYMESSTTLAEFEKQAREAKAQGNWQLSKENWQKCVDLAEERLDFHLEVAIAQRSCKEYEESMITLELALNRFGPDCWIFDNIARIHSELGKREEAKVAWQAALDLAKDQAVKNIFPANQGIFEDILKAIDAQQQEFFAQEMHAIEEAIANRDSRSALELLKSAQTRFPPKTSDDVRKLAGLYHKLDDRRSEIQLWETFTGENPKDLFGQLTLAIMYRESGNFDLSLKVLLASLENFGENCWIYDNLARLSILQGAKAKAESYWKKAAKCATEPAEKNEFQSMLRSLGESVQMNQQGGFIEFLIPDSKSPQTIGLWVDDEIIPNVKWSEESAGQHIRLRMALPTRYLDGRIHIFEARDIHTGHILGIQADVPPHVSTPWTVLLKYSHPPFPGYLSPMASDRYLSLQYWLSHFQKSPERAIALDQLPLTHDILVQGFEQKRRAYEKLRFPVYSQPKVSIVVPVHNKFTITYHCLAALLFAFNETSFEVIIVDDGSDPAEDTVVLMPQTVTGIQIIRNELALGFVGACNAGAAIAKGDYILFLNNDTEPTAKWLDELIFVFDHFENVGLAGSKLVYPDGRLQEAGGIIWKNGDPWNYGRGGNPQDPRYNYTREIDYLSGAAIILPRTIWEEVGGFSREFAPAYFEDTDLACKIRHSGRRLVYAARSKVYHFEGMSCGTDTGGSGLKRFQEINRPKFKQRWASMFRTHGNYGEKPDLEKDRNVRFRVLFIDAECPRPDRDAGSYAAIQEIRLIQSLGAKATFLPTNLAYMGAYTEDLQRMGVEAIYAPFTFSIEDFLKERGGEFDAVYITRYYVARDFLSIVRRYAPQAKVLFCNADLHFLRQLREALYHDSDPQRMLEAARTRDAELEIMRQVDVTLSYNSIEHAVILSHNMDQGQTALCPWVVEVVESVPQFAERQDVAFLGNYQHPPNYEAVEFFARQVLPKLRADIPDISFRVYGSNVSEKLEKLAKSTPGLVLCGYVENVAEIYNTCRVFIAPLQSGAGIKGKVISALGYGVPQVLSPLAAEGTGLGDGIEVHIASTPEEWVNAVTELYNNPQTWQSMSTAAQDKARRHYSFKQGRNLMRKALQSASIFVGDQEFGLHVTRV